MSHQSWAVETRMIIHTAEALRELIESLLPYVVPVLVYPEMGPGAASWITGGTALLAQTGTSRFLITADHVLSKIDELRDKSEIVVLLGGVHAPPVDITLWPSVARDSFTDIGTIQVPPDSESRDINKEFFYFDLALPARAAVGDQALILGFPAGHRCASGNKINARVLPIFDYVTDVGVRRFTIADENNRREILINPSNLSFPDHVGGMSGAPVFRISDSVLPSLVGVLSESGDGLRGAHFCAHADFILPDGSLDHSALPPR